MHGGEKFTSSAIVTEMEDYLKQYVYFSGVDNILVNFVDEVFLGGMIDTGNTVATKSVLKAYPEEKVGVICNRCLFLIYTKNLAIYLYFV